MGSVGFGEIAFIAIVALLVFGPDRLPELARKAGELMTKAREATRSFTDALDSEFKESAAPIRSLQTDFQATKDELRSAAGTVMDLNLDVSITGQNPIEVPTEEVQDADSDGDTAESEDTVEESEDAGLQDAAADVDDADTEKQP